MNQPGATTYELVLQRVRGRILRKRGDSPLVRRALKEVLG